MNVQEWVKIIFIIKGIKNSLLNSEIIIKNTLVLYSRCYQILKMNVVNRKANNNYFKST